MHTNFKNIYLAFPKNLVCNNAKENTQISQNYRALRVIETLCAIKCLIMFWNMSEFHVFKQQMQKLKGIFVVLTSYKKHT